MVYERVRFFNAVRRGRERVRFTRRQKEEAPRKKNTRRSDIGTIGYENRSGVQGSIEKKKNRRRKAIPAMEQKRWTVLPSFNRKQTKRGRGLIVRGGSGRLNLLETGGDQRER